MTAKRKTLVMGLILAILVWATYHNSLKGPFLFDDWHVISKNPSVRGPGNIPSFFTDISTFSLLPANRDYRPLFLTSMALSWWAANGETLPFHLVSVTLHLLNVLCLFLICRLLFRQGQGARGGLPALEAEKAAFIAAALFAVHPLASESINYISSQAVPLSICFYLASLYFFLKVHGERESVSRSGTRWRLGLSYLAYFCALLSKPIAISLPAILMLWEVTFGQAHAPERKNTLNWGFIRTRLLKHLPFWGLSIIFIMIRSSLFNSPFGGAQPIRPLWDHYLTETGAIVWYYLKLSILPTDLNADIDYPISTSLLDPWVASSVLIILSVGFLLWRYRRNWNLVFWASWFVIGLLLTTYLVPLRQVVNEHRVYLSLAGFCALTALSGWRLHSYLLSRFPMKQNPGKLSRYGLILLLSAVGYMGHETYSRNRVWSSEVSIWKDAALNGGTWRAHMNYALALEKLGFADEALLEFEQAVKLGSYAFAHLNLGLALVKRDQLEKGLMHLRTAVRLWPAAPEPHLHLGYGLMRAGDYAAAEKSYVQALRLRPNYLKGYRYLAQLYETQHRWDEAWTTYQASLKLDPGQKWVNAKLERLQPRYVELLFREAFALQKSGKIPAAIVKYKQLLQLAPDHRQGSFNVAYAYMKGRDPGKWKRAAKLFENVLKIDPSYVETYHHLATVYWQLERRGDAIAADERYLDLGNHRDLEKVSIIRLEQARSSN